VLTLACWNWPRRGAGLPVRALLALYIGAVAAEHREFGVGVAGDYRKERRLPLDDCRGRAASVWTGEAPVPPPARFHIPCFLSKSLAQRGENAVAPAVRCRRAIRRYRLQIGSLIFFCGICAPCAALLRSGASSEISEGGGRNAELAVRAGKVTTIKWSETIGHLIRG